MTDMTTNKENTVSEEQPVTQGIEEDDGFTLSDFADLIEGKA